jgi:hypothetical protein
MSTRSSEVMFAVCPWTSTSESLRSMYLIGRFRFPCAPTSAHRRHSRATTAMSVSVTLGRLRAISHSSRLVMIPYFVKITMSGFRPKSLSLT